MITPQKIEIFKNYRGYYDVYYIQNKDKPKIISDDEWNFLNNIIEEIYLVKQGLSSKAFGEKTMQKLHANCDSLHTANFVIELSII